MGIAVYKLRCWCLLAASVEACIETANAQSTFPHWPRHTVQWGHQATLQDLLKAGVKVKHFDQYASLRKLTIKNAWISFQHPGQEPLPYFPIDQAEVVLYSNYELDNIDVRSYPLTLAEIKAMGQQWLGHAQVPPAVDWPMLERVWYAYAHNGGVEPKNYAGARTGFPVKVSPVPDFRSVKYETWNPTAAFGFQQSYDPARPMVAGYHAEWGNLKPTTSRTYMESPAKPPPGWEHLDFKTDRVQFLDSLEARAFHQAVTDPNAVWVEPESKAAVAPADKARVPTLNPVPTAARPGPAGSEEKTSTWWKWLLVIIAVGFAARQAWQSHIAKR
jgi:hypothetical protein